MYLAVLSEVSVSACLIVAAYTLNTEKVSFLYKRSLFYAFGLKVLKYQVSTRLDCKWYVSWLQRLSDADVTLF